MASFADKLPQFNPYVQQLPVEAMVQVGMQKQQQYNEGIQKIQTQIDNVAGLDVMRDTDKQYLQSKLDSLGNRLKVVAAGDFSNFQLVNSTGGMISQISKDPTILNAVTSTQRVRKGMSERDTAKAAGKSSVQNDWYLDNGINQYLNTTDPNASYSGGYVEYTDVTKKLSEVAEKMHEIDNSIEIPFQRDNAGNTLYFGKDDKGKPTVSIDPNSGGTSRIDDAILAIKTKGKPAEKILSNFYSNLNENDQRQLQIDGAYHYRGATAETFKSDILANYNSAKKLTSDEVVNLTLELTTNSKLTTAQKSGVQARITTLNTALTDGSLEKELNSQLAGLSNPANIENYKTQLYTQKSLTKLAKDMSYKSTEQEYKTNPYAQADMAKKHLQLSYDNARRDQQNFNATFGLQKARFSLDQAELMIKQQEKLGSQPVVFQDRIATDVDVPSLDKLNDEIDVLQKVNVAELNAKYAKVLPGCLSLPNVADKKVYLDGLVSAYAKDPSFIDTQTNAEVKEYLKQRSSYDILISRKQALATEAIKSTAHFDEEASKILSGKLSEKNSSVGESLKYAVNAASPIPLMSPSYIKDIRDIGERKLKAQSDFLAARMPERQTMSGTLSLDNKADMDHVNQLISQKTIEHAKGGVDVEKLKDFNPESLAKSREKPTNMGYTITKKYDGSAELIITDSGAITQKIPMSSREYSAYFPNYSRSNPVSDIKYSILSSPNKTTNLTGVTDGSSAINSGLSGYDLPQIAGTAIAPLVRADVTGSAFNDGSDNDKYQVTLYVNDNGVWIPEVLNSEYVHDGGLQEIIKQVGSKTIEQIIAKHKKTIK